MSAEQLVISTHRCNSSQYWILHLTCASCGSWNTAFDHHSIQVCPFFALCRFGKHDIFVRSSPHLLCHAVPYTLRVGVEYQSWPHTCARCLSRAQYASNVVLLLRMLRVMSKPKGWKRSTPSTASTTVCVYGVARADSADELFVAATLRTALHASDVE